MKKTFLERIKAKWSEGKYVSIGLDPVWDKLPQHIQKGARKYGDPDALFEFLVEIVKSTDDIACCYKPNASFFEAFGQSGWEALSRICAYINRHTDVPIIYDAKRGDIDSTNVGYVISAFDMLSADAITVQPWLGSEAMKPFLDRADRGVIVLCRTSNKGSGQFQARMTPDETGAMIPMYEHVAKIVRDAWNYSGNCMLVVGATYPNELERVRKIVGTMPILVPGIGAQGGDLTATLNAGLIPGTNKGLIINSSRGIIYASSNEDFGIKAREETINLNEAICSHMRQAA